MGTTMRMLLMLVVVVLTAALFFLLLSDEPTAPAPDGEEHLLHWSYEPGTGPADWGAINPAWRLCAEGRAQSPIDLTNAEPAELPPVELRLPSGRDVEVLNQEGVIDALDNGHTIQVNAKTGETMTVGDKSYALLQFHLHAPSEHTVDGRRYPMEMHFVYQAEDSALAVLGLFIEEGAENRAFAPLWKQLEEAPGTHVTVQLPINFDDGIFAGGEPTGVFHYEGSLTNPPCTEGVKWFILRTPTEVSKAQIAAFADAYEGNSRPVQPLNGRMPYLDETPNVTIR
jgi:carbonic anhydrase